MDVPGQRRSRDFLMLYYLLDLSCYELAGMMLFAAVPSSGSLIDIVLRKDFSFLAFICL